MHLTRTRVAAGLTAIALTGTAAAIVSTSAGGATQDLVQVAATEERAPVALSAEQRRALQGPAVASFGVDLERVVEVPAPDAVGQWQIVPGERGVCLRPADGAVTCGSAEQLERGLVFLARIDPGSGLPEKLSAEQMPGPGRTPAPIENVPITGDATIRGLAPDGVLSVVARGAEGQELATASVSDNVYRIAGLRLERLAGLELVRADGKRSLTPIG